MTLQGLFLSLGFDESGLRRGAAEINDFVSKAKKQFKSLDDFAGSLDKIGKKLTLGLTLPIAALGAFGLKQALDSEQIARGFAATFGSAVDSVTQHLERLRDVIPAGNSELQAMAVRMQGLLRPLGIVPDRARAMTVNLLGMAGALAKTSTSGQGVEDALEALRGGLAGNTRGLKDFNVIIDDQQIKQEALRLGILRTGQELTAAGRATVVYSLLQSKLAPIQEQAARATTTNAEKLRFLARDAKEAAEGLATKLLPAFTLILSAGTKVVDMLGSSNATAFTVGLLALAAAAGPVLRGGALMIRTIGAITTLLRGMNIQAGLSMALFRTGIPSAFSTAAISGTGLRGVLASLAGTALPGLGQLAILLTAVGGAFAFMASKAHESGAAMRDSRKRVEEFIGSLNLLTDAQIKSQAASLAAEATRLATERAGVLSKIREIDPQRRAALFRGDDAAAKQFGVTLGELSRRNLVLTSSLDEVIAKERALGEQFKKNAELFGDLTPPPGDLTIPTGDAVKPIDEIAKRLELMQRAFDLVTDKTKLPVEIWTAFPQVQADINRLLAQQADFLSEDAVRLREMATAAEDLKKALRVPDSFVTQLGTFAELAAKLNKAVGVTPGGPASITTATPFKLPKIETKPGVAGLTDLERALESLRSAGEDAFGGIQNGIAGMSDALRGALGDTLLLLSGLQQGAGALARISRESKKSKAEGGSGFASLGAIASAVGAIGAIGGAVASLANAIFGQSEHQRELRRVLESNAERISEATLALNNGLKSASAIAKVQRAIVDPNVLSAARQTQLPGFNQTATTLFLNTQLKKLGVTFEQINAIAKENGIQLLDSKGKIVAGSLEQLAEMLGITVQSLTQWGNSLDAQRQRLDLRALVSGTDRSPIDIINDEIALLMKAGSPLAALFEGLNAGTLEGRGAIRNRLSEILDQIDAGALSLEDLGGLTGLDDLTSIIRAVAEAMNGLESSTRAVTESQSSLPTWYKATLNLLRFQSAQPQTSTGAMPSRGGGSSIVIEEGAIVVNAGEGQDAREIADTVLAEFEQRARRQFGNPTQFGGIV